MLARTGGTLLRDRFGTAKPIVAMCHLPGLPGRPRHDRAAGMGRIIDSLAHDLPILHEAGVDGLLFCNEADLPYQLQVGPEIPAAMAAAIGQLRAEIRLPFGVNIVWDPRASLAVARATGATFVREVFTGVYESDHGIMQPDFGALAAYRTAIGADDVLLFCNITPEFASSLGRRTIAQRAQGAAFLGADVILISGQLTGTPIDLAELRAAAEAVPATPVLANTGVRAETVAEILSIADGALVGTTLKRDGVTWNPVDRERAMRFMDAVRATREPVAVG
ncbi:MAG TPA: BtpA/SgcQ family protein [Candidatus Limnocylindrales bacterium]|nr:BtpA/SgcQ family protein [Candidatus Limnocylindrales bacterium]